MENGTIICLLLCFIITSGEQTEEIIDTSNLDDKAIESYPNLNCSITVNHTSAICLADIILSLQVKFVQMTLIFPKTVKLNQTAVVINPREWFWSYTPVKGSFPYFKWPWDFSILSFGLLETYTLRNFKLFLDVTTENCSIELGSRAASMSISRALANMTSTYLSPAKSDYDHSYWCYMQQFSNAKDTLAYTMGVYTGYPSEFVGYRCCRFKVNKLTRHRSVECFSTPLQQWRSLLILPFILGVILLLYSPLILMTISIHFSRSGYTKIECSRQGYKNLETDDVDNSPWVILNNSCPMSVTIIVLSFGRLSETHPEIASRIRRALFVLVSPVLVYVKVLTHFYLQRELSMVLIEQGAPLGFISMIAGFEKSRRVFLTVLGGPCVVFTSYLILGLFMISVPANLAKIFEDGLSANCSRIPRTILGLDLDTVQKISLVTFSQHAGYKKVLEMMKAQCCMILRPRYWSELFSIQSQRWTVFSSTYFQSQSFFVCLINAITKVLCFVIYIIICGIEIVIGVLYYGLPIIYFTIIGIRGFVKNFAICVAKSKIGHAQTNSTRHFYCTICRCVCKCVFSVCFVYFTVCFCEIVCASFEFFANVICFSYLSAIVFPDDSFGYLFFGISFLYFVWNILSKFGKQYHELLNMTVAVCKSMLIDKSQFVDLVDDALVLPQLNFMHKVRRLKLNQTWIHLTKEQRKQFKITPKSELERHVQCFNGRPAISKHLFDHVVRKHRPIHINLFLTFVELSFICVLVFISLTVFSQFYHSRDTSGVIKVLTMLVIGTLPQILRSMFLDKHQTIGEADLSSQIKQTVTEFCNDENIYRYRNDDSSNFTRTGNDSTKIKSDGVFGYTCI